MERLPSYRLSVHPSFRPPCRRFLNLVEETYELLSEVVLELVPEPAIQRGSLIEADQRIVTHIVGGTQGLFVEGEWKETVDHGLEVVIIQIVIVTE